MTGESSGGFGLWGLVALNSLVFVGFAYSFFKPTNARDWRSFGAFSAFIVALFAEMYGFPLTIYFLSGWLQMALPTPESVSHDAGHLWWTLLGLRGDPHSNPIHILSIVVIGGGFVLLANAWHVLYRAQREHRLATRGPYTRIRHPQYLAFMLIMAGFLLQWPTLLTIFMFPILVIMYARLARTEDKNAEREFGAPWREYAARTPSFLPRLWNRAARPIA